MSRFPRRYSPIVDLLLHAHSAIAGIDHVTLLHDPVMRVCVLAHMMVAACDVATDLAAMGRGLLRWWGRG